MFVFFFSSRRRHTRLQGDWSSDVCSSDLCLKPSVGLHERLGFERGGLLPAIGFKHGCWHDIGWGRLGLQTLGDFPEGSGERRVGEECRSWGAPYHLKKKKKSVNG